MKCMALSLAALIAACTPAVAQKIVVDHASLSQEMNAMTSHEWRSGVEFGNKLAALPGNAGFELLRENWKGGASIEAREQMFKGFVFKKPPGHAQVGAESWRHRPKC